MLRDEQISQANPYDNGNPYWDVDNDIIGARDLSAHCAFEEGAEWADAHPNWHICKNNDLPKDYCIVWCYCDVWSYDRYRKEYKCMYYYPSWEYRDGIKRPCFIEVGKNEDDGGNWAQPDTDNREFKKIYVIAWFDLPNFD